MDLIVFSYIFDLIFGDPQWFLHPVRLMGRLISFLEKILNKKGNKIIQILSGIITWFLVIFISGISTYLIIKIAQRINPFIGKIVWVFISYTTLATKDLSLHAYAVFKMLEKNDIIGARKKLSLMVGRDTEKLSKDEIICATVESIAENTNDGIISPLFYLFLGGPVLAIIFKAISTLDSEIGHKNERFLYFGWFSAKLDTIANFIPARITGFLIPLASLFCGKNLLKSFRIMLRDGRKQDSINSAISEAAMAGALEIRLGGNCNYSGIIVKHPYLGDGRKPKISHINEAIAISLVSSLLMLLFGIFFKYLFCYGENL
ncbi:MAG: adenosylcobinamide-phosphate synthase CbiB [Candidatus Omnitrophica bacterium]|nr:adenosylcobinamide-phosphate synthase CbiB [Candidatus Omnitrophota bacterium]